MEGAVVGFFAGVVLAEGFAAGFAPVFAADFGVGIFVAGFAS